MQKLFKFLLLLPLFLCGENLEVPLATRSQLPPVYLSRVHVVPAQTDWRYFDELRSILEFDLNASGFCSIPQTDSSSEEALHWPEVRKDFHLAYWKKEHIPFVLAVQVFQNKLSVIAFNTQDGTSKKLPDVSLAMEIEEDRQQIHQIADILQKDLFGAEGIASLKILYARREQVPELLSEIWLCDADGARPRQITAEHGYCLSPGTFPSKESDDAPGFYYVANRNGQAKICALFPGKSTGEILVSLRGNQMLPAVNKKGTQMAFITDVAGRPDLFVQNFGANGRPLGKARQLFTCPRATQASPTFSPDGKKIAFVSDKDGPPRVYSMDVVSPKETQRAKPLLITRKNRENTSPAWSPDGKKLAYSAKTDGVRQIWVYDFATDEEIQLTTGPEDKENPSWAPNNLHLLYNTESQESCELFLIHLNHPEPIQISKGAGQKRFPTWGSPGYSLSQRFLSLIPKKKS